jgi:hypothetical protein
MRLLSAKLVLVNLIRCSPREVAKNYNKAFHLANGIILGSRPAIRGP